MRAAFEASGWLVYTIPDESTIPAEGRNFEQLSIFGYQFDTSDNLEPASPWVNDVLTRQYPSPYPGRLTLVTVVNDVGGATLKQKDPAVALRVLSNAASRARLEDQIVLIAPKADGVEIDFESMAAETRPYFTQFIQELRAKLPAGKKLSVAIQPQADSAPGSGGRAIDWQGIEPYVDYLKLMAYYFSFGGTPPGPVLSLDQAAVTAQYAVQNRGLPLSKLHMALCVAGYDWPLVAGGRGRAVDYATSMQLAKTPGASLERMADDTLRIRYADASGQARIIYIDDKASLMRKIAIFQSYGVHHIDFWQMGTGDPAFWKWVGDQAIGPSTSAPAILSLTPANAQAGAAGFTLQVLGRNFASTSAVLWNGASRTTRFVDASHLEVTVPASDVAQPGEATLRGFTPGASGGLSIDSTFLINKFAEVPGLQSLTPASGAVNGGAFTLTVCGSFLRPSAVVSWNGQPRATTLVDGSHVSAQIMSGDRPSAGFIPVTVVNPNSNNVPSAPLYFNVGYAPPAPDLLTLAPASALTTSAPPAVTLIGANFPTDAQVFWNGSSRAPARLDANRLQLTLAASDLSKAASIPVFVRSASVHRDTPTLFFTVAAGAAPVPQVTQLSPGSGVVGGAAFTMKVIGRGFTPASVVLWNDEPRSTVFVDASHLQVSILSADRARSNDVPVVVFTPAPGGGRSNAIPFWVGGADGAAPALTRLSPSQGVAGGGAFTMAIIGNNFRPGAVALWNGAPKLATLIDSTQLQIQIAAADRAKVGQIPITVVNLSPDDESNALFFTATAPVRSAAAPAATVGLSPILAAPRVYPNPWRADQHAGSPVHFDHLGDAPQLKIFTISGRWVQTLPVAQSAAEWDRKTSGGDEAASGLYFYLAQPPNAEPLRGTFVLIR